MIDAVAYLLASALVFEQGHAVAVPKAATVLARFRGTPEQCEAWRLGFLQGRSSVLG